MLFLWIKSVENCEWWFETRVWFMRGASNNVDVVATLLGTKRQTTTVHAWNSSCFIGTVATGQKWRQRRRQCSARECRTQSRVCGVSRCRSINCILCVWSCGVLWDMQWNRWHMSDLFIAQRTLCEIIFLLKTTKAQFIFSSWK